MKKLSYSKIKISIAQRQPLVKNLLIVEGITRAGKFLAANIVNGFKGVEPVQGRGFMEYLSYLPKFGLIEKKTAQELLRSEVDMSCYEMLIGRTLNYRKFDKSSIYNIPHYKKYLERAKIEDRDFLLRQFYQKSMYSFFIVHELMPNIKIYFETFPELKVISLRRSPMDLVYSWYKRGIVRRTIKDPRLFVIPLWGGHGSFPWYIYGHENEYKRLSEMDKIIFSITTLLDLYKISFKKLTVQNKKKILFVRFEDFLTKPKKVIKLIEVFIKKKATFEVNDTLRRERLPSPDFLKSQNQKIKEIKKLASPEYFKRLEVLEREYHQE